MKDPGHYTPQGFENWNPAHRGAYLKGWRAFVAGEPRGACPYVDIRKPSGRLSWSRSFIRAWEDGWDDAQKDAQITAMYRDASGNGQPPPQPR